MAASSLGTQTSNSLASSKIFTDPGLLTSVESVETTDLVHTIVFQKGEKPALDELLKELREKVAELDDKWKPLKLKVSQRANAPGQWLQSGDEYQKDRETGKLLKRFHQRQSKRSRLWETKPRMICHIWHMPALPLDTHSRLYIYISHRRRHHSSLLAEPGR